MMRLIKTYLIITLLVFSISLACAQKRSAASPLQFDTESWNFGEIDELAGRVSHTFTYFNASDKPMVPEIVRTSCGCTTVSYNHKPVMAGATGEITVYFDPANLPGQFHKTVSFITNGGKTEYTLKIDGFVKPREKGVDEQYPYPIAEGLQTSCMKVNFGYLRHGKPQTKVIGLINTSDKTLTISADMVDKSGYMTIEYPERLKAGAKGELKITYLVPTATYGTVDDRFLLVINGKKSDKAITVSGIAIENTTVRASSPEFRYEPSIVDFGVKSSRSSYSSKIRLINGGKEPLIIRKIEYNGGTWVDIKVGQVIGAGETLTATLKLTPLHNAKGVVNGSVTLFTNDPKRPMREIRCKVSIK